MSNSTDTSYLDYMPTDTGITAGDTGSAYDAYPTMDYGTPPAPVADYSAPAALQPNIMQPGGGPAAPAGGGAGGGMGLQQLLQLAAILGGGGAGLAGALGGGASQTATMTPAQKAALNASQANQQQQAAAAQQQMALTQPGFQQGMGILTGLGQGQLPPGLLDLITKSYQPTIGNIITGGIENARNRGFASAGPNDMVTGGPAAWGAAPQLANMPANIIDEALRYSQGLAQNLMNPYGNAVGQQQAAGQAANAGLGNVGLQQPAQPSVGQRIGQGLGGLGAGVDLATLLGGRAGLTGLFGNQTQGQQQPSQGGGGLSNPYSQNLGIGGY